MNGMVCALAIVSILGSQAWAAEPPARKSKSPDKSRVGAKGDPLPLLPSTTAPIALTDVLAHFEEYGVRIKGLSARFRQSVILEDAGVTQAAQGRVDFAKPRRLRVEHSHPQRQTLVADGRALWIWRPDPGQAIEADLDEWLRSEPLALSLMDLGSYGSIAKRYQVSLSTIGAPGPDGHRELRLTMRPRTPGAQFSLLVSLSTRHYFPMESTLSAGRVTVTTRFDEVRLNPDFPPDHFRFAPPPGAEVLTTFKPPVIK